ncbi:DUF3325 domain-containing protein [Pseudoroseomonas ludipueritiae]|uniref:DUF3325 domain-containing protein n=1 Tax=Pseudoroseomonas ludipueritiae TaxID=198093 RepID=A0ABR7R4C5_9PROT|nr:DUF3325 domain-containing protein [Pseudoroseomonas ludipueritiae]MBC9176630.1 DUF3325 domain-containing protein [Pseudoroseomonas ludipueritiae]
MIVLGFALAYAGFSALCLSMERHHEQVFRRRRLPPWRRRVLAYLGWVLLMSSLPPVVQAFGWGTGLAFWAGILTATAMPLAMLLTYAPRAALVLAVGSVPAGLLLLLAGA